MGKIVEKCKYYEVVVEEGNDWGMDSHVETYTYNTKEWALKRAQEAHEDYYSNLISIREVVEYDYVEHEQ